MSESKEMPENCYKNSQGVLRKLNMSPVVAHVLGGAALVAGGAVNIIIEAKETDAIAKVIDKYPELSSQMGTLLFEMGALNLLLMLFGAFLICYSPQQANNSKI